LRRPQNAKDTHLRLFGRDKNTGQTFMHPLFETTIEDIFNKYDMNMNKVLGYKEFKGFCDCIGKRLS